jgi:hypothetical protein
MTLLNALSAPSSVLSASALRAASTKRLYCAGSSGFGAGFFAMPAPYHDLSGSPNSRNLRRTHSSKVSGLGLGAMSCFVSEPLALGTFNRDGFALHVIDAKLGAGVHAEIKFRQIPVKMLTIDVLVNADQAALEHAEKAFKRIGMHVAASPLEFMVVNGFMGSETAVLVVLAHVGNEAAIAVRHLPQMGADTTVIERHRPNVAAAFHKAENLGVVSAAPEAFRPPRLARPRDFGFVRLNRLANAAERASIGSRRHRQADAVPKVPRGFHTAAEHPLKLARRNAFLRRAKQMDGLKPHAQGKVAILKNRALAHGKGRATAGVALAQADLDNAFGVLLAGLRPHTCQAPNLLRGRAAMRAGRAFRPDLAFDVIESGFLAKEPGVGKDGLGHG